MAWLEVSGGGPVQVDDDLLAELSAVSWHIDGAGYARRTIRLGKGSGARKTAEFLHRRIVGAKPGQIVDHRDGNPLNNRRENLRFVTAQGNARNIRRSKNIKAGGFKGVYFVKKSGKWAAKIGAGERRPNGRSSPVHIGCFKTECEAAKAYDRAALFFFGEHAALNFESDRQSLLAELREAA